MRCDHLFRHFEGKFKHGFMHVFGRKRVLSFGYIGIERLRINDSKTNMLKIALPFNLQSPCCAHD